MIPPLTGVRVLDLSTGIAGPYGTKLLADAGADVLKIEQPGGDPLRRWTASGTVLPAGEDGVLFRFLNTSKRAAVVDYATPAGREQVLALAAVADLVIESMVPGAIEALGLGPEALWERNPLLSLVSVSPFGRGGPWSQRPATEFTLQAWCGSTAARGTTDQPPIAAGGRLGEWMGGAYAAVAALTAYHGARRSGRGEHVDLSLFEVMALTMAPNIAVWESLAGQPSLFSRTLEIPSIVRARDGYVGFCTITGQQWRDFVVLIERSDLVDDPTLARWDERVRRCGEVTRMIEAWTMQRCVCQWVLLVRATRCPGSTTSSRAVHSCSTPARPASSRVRRITCRRRHCVRSRRRPSWASTGVNGCQEIPPFSKGGQRADHSPVCGSSTSPPSGPAPLSPNISPRWARTSSRSNPSNAPTACVFKA